MPFSWPLYENGKTREVGIYPLLTIRMRQHTLHVIRSTPGGRWSIRPNSLTRSARRYADLRQLRATRAPKAHLFDAVELDVVQATYPWQKKARNQAMRTHHAPDVAREAYGPRP